MLALSRIRDRTEKQVLVRAHGKKGLVLGCILKLLNSVSRALYCGVAIGLRTKGTHPNGGLDQRQVVFQTSQVQLLCPAWAF